MKNSYYLGLDVGSTTVKSVFYRGIPGFHETEPELLWKKYERHETRQAEKALEYLSELEKSFPDHFYAGNPNLEIYCTGSGGANLAQAIGARQIQEVLSVSTAVDRLFPQVSSVVELGGQDAKIILFKETQPGKPRKKIMTMNDKCAGGTGAVVDKIAGKLMLTPADLKELPYSGVKLHPVAGKCGVFAETDINSLQKNGVPSEELMASLFEALVQQNLSVLTRGNTLMPHVLLLGGPNTFIPALQDAWRENFARLWQERNIDLPEGYEHESLLEKVSELVFAPENAELFAAMGAIMAGAGEKLSEEAPRFHGSQKLKTYIEERSKQIRGGGVEVKEEPHEIREFKKRYMQPEWITPVFSQERVEAILGLDGGSTSTKGVLLNFEGEVIATEYVLSKGNPISDTIQVVRGLREQVEKNGATLEIAAAGVTGYAKEVLKDVFGADIAVVETVAHARAAMQYYPGAEVIVDVGGQDIKIIQMKDGRVKDFKLNTQCSAGNGYFLQNTAEGFGYNVNEYADVAFSARKFPQFGYGCAVFLQTDIVDFQRQGWESPEILAGLANVLPKNIWQYVAKVPNVSMFGTRFVLQGGTQKNAAAVKAQVDYLIEKFKGTGIEPEIQVHRFTSVCGAIGAALEAISYWSSNSDSEQVTSFIGLDAVETVRYKSTHNESTRCHFCKNKCIRTFIDVQIAAPEGEETAAGQTRQLIIAPCEKGAAENIEEMKTIKHDLDRLKEENPNLSEWAAKNVWKSRRQDIAKYESLCNRTREKEKNSQGKLSWFKKEKTPEKNRKEIERYASILKGVDKRDKARSEIQIGFPRVLNHYTLQPFFTAYFETLGIPWKNMRFSSYTSEQLYKEGGKRGTVDPCFPSKVSIAHVHNLLEKHKKKPLDYLFFPIVNTYPTPMSNVIGNNACPTAAGSAEMAYSAFVKESDMFTENGIMFLKPYLNLDAPQTAEREMFRQVAMVMGVSEQENRIAMRAGYRALNRYKKEIQQYGREIIDMVSRQGRIAIVLLARTYHDDPGVNHEIMELFQERGYPVLNISSLPMDRDYLETIFTDTDDPLDIHDVWKNSFSASSSLKIWAAKFIARHPNLVPVELSSFKCGHDSMLYSTVEKIIEYSQTPYFSFKDIDENNPTGSVKIRVETIDYFLKEYAGNLQNGITV